MYDNEEDENALERVVHHSMAGVYPAAVTEKCVCLRWKGGFVVAVKVQLCGFLGL